jgi:hypothetical protein
MHDDHDHGPHHPHDPDRAPGPAERADVRRGGLGHNAPPRAPVAWQLPGPAHPGGAVEPGGSEPDFDLVESAFVEGFQTASDPVSFLRLAGVPFLGRDAAGRRLCLLRVELEQKVDVGAITPLLGGTGFRYDPLPARLVSRRLALALVYAEGERTVRLSLAEARALLADPAPFAGRP